jgi:hypothetical protein
MRRLGILALIVGGLVAAVGASARAEVDGPAGGDERVPPRPGIEVEDNEVSKIIFLNRCAAGCLIQPGPNDARINTSSIPDATSFVNAFEHGDEVWNQVVQCVSEIYAPYDVVVTDVDPGENLFHHEAIVAGDWNEIGYPYPVGGVAPSQCVPRNNVISFTFANGYGPNAQRICEVIGQETAHSFGLEHAFDCSDPMTYLSPCGRQFFRDKTTPCGEYEASAQCQCGGSAQNSHRWLRTVLGANPNEVPGPEVEMLAPAADATVSAGFSVRASATHMRGIGRVDLFINGTKYGTVDGFGWNEQSRIYELTAPASLPDGIMDVEIRAYSDIETETIASVTVTMGAPCASADSCLAAQQCDQGRCFFPPATGELGDACVAGEECLSGLCPTSGTEGYCSQLCFPTTTEESCPMGFQCQEVSANQGVCWPASGGGGGCNTSGGASWLSGLWMLGLALVLRRRVR